MDALARVGFGLFGLAVLIGIAWLFSNNKKAVDWRLVLTGVTLQVGFAALVLLVPGGRDVFDWLGQGFVKVLSFVAAGSTFIFGSLMDTSKYGFIFAFQVLADDHLLRLADGRALPPGRDAGGGARDGVGDHQGDARVGRGDDLGVRERLHRPDRGAADGAPVHPAL
jgi:hypothetical protein